MHDRHRFSPGHKGFGDFRKYSVRGGLGYFWSIGDVPRSRGTEDFGEFFKDVMDKFSNIE